ncbi:MAG: LD-carboxypeptidase [Planctomycetota bacterium]
MTCLGATSTLVAGEVLVPRALRPGDTIQIVAPAGLLDRERIERATERLRAMGFTVKTNADAYQEAGYLAGTDERRANEINQAFRDPDVDAVFPGTGGYGTMRILERLDYDLIRQNPKILIGFSDITALHTAIHQQTGLITFHSPVPMWGLGSEENLTPFSAHYFWRALLADQYPPGETGYLISAEGNAVDTRTDPDSSCELGPPTTVHGGKAQGRLIGGNLSLVAATIGTPYEVDTTDRILFLEDVGEAPYRIDRMLCQLRLAGAFDGCRGVVLGQFTRRKNEDTSEEVRTIDEVLDEYFQDLGVPVLRDFPMGHHPCNATFPVGAQCELDADAGTLRVLQNPVQP